MLDVLDTVKFYSLLAKYNKVSANIGVIGNHNHFIDYINKLQKECKRENLKFKINEDKTKFSIFYEDDIVNYIQIESLEKLNSLHGIYFRRYV